MPYAPNTWKQTEAQLRAAKQRIEQLEAKLRPLTAFAADVIIACNENSDWLKADPHGPYIGYFYYRIKDRAVKALAS